MKIALVKAADYREEYTINTTNPVSLYTAASTRTSAVIVVNDRKKIFKYRVKTSYPSTYHIRFFHPLGPPENIRPHNTTIDDSDEPWGVRGVRGRPWRRTDNGVERNNDSMYRNS